MAPILQVKHVQGPSDLLWKVDIVDNTELAVELLSAATVCTVY